ncbi:MAG: metallophosphoesterase [Verrucomicrobiota bacterium]
MKAEPLDPVSDNEFTIVVIPDTQHYLGPETKIERAGTHPFAEFPGSPYVSEHVAWAGEQSFPGDKVVNPYLMRHIEWILANRESQRIMFVTHVGDIVEDNRKIEWDIAREAFEPLLGLIPFGLAVGNHDMEPNGDASLFQEAFSANFFADQPWYLESFEHNRPDAQMVSRDNVNSAQIFTALGIDFLFLHLECNAPDEVLDWANALIRNHPERRVLITTHMDLGIRKKPKTSEGYIHDPKGRMEWTKIHKERGNSAAEIWEKCYQLHPNLEFIFSGDQSRVTAMRIAQKGANGNTVHSLLSDYHSLGGLRLMRFSANESGVKVITYDTMLEKLVEATPYVPDREQHQFSLP